MYTLCTLPPYALYLIVLLVIALSTNILWRVQINLRTKLALFGLCSLTAIVITLSLVRVVISRQSGLVDFISLILWAAIELSVGMSFLHISVDVRCVTKNVLIAIILACLAAFRNLYVATRNGKVQSENTKYTPCRRDITTQSNATDELLLGVGAHQRMTEISSMPRTFHRTTSRESFSDEESLGSGGIHITYDFRIRTDIDCNELYQPRLAD